MSGGINISFGLRKLKKKKTTCLEVFNLVEPESFEPATPTMPLWCSPS